MELRFIKTEIIYKCKNTVKKKKRHRFKALWQYIGY